MLAHERERVGDHAAGPGHRLDLGGGLANDHEAHPRLVDGLLDLGEDFVLRPVAVDPDEIAEDPVVPDERLRLAVVELEPLLDRLRRVVCPPLFLGAPMQALERDLVGDLKLEDDRQRAADLGQHRVERLRLGHRAREAVEDEPVLGVLGLEPLPDQLDHQVVGDELAALEDRLHAAPELAAFGDRVPQHVAGRDVREPVVRGDALGLRPLAGPLDAEEKHV